MIAMKIVIEEYRYDAEDVRDVLWDGAFQTVDGEALVAADGGRLLFRDFFNCDGSPSAAAVGKFMENLGVAKLSPPADGVEVSEEGTEG